MRINENDFEPYKNWLVLLSFASNINYDKRNLFLKKIYE